MTRIALLLPTLLLVSPAAAQPEATVQIPLADYQALLRPREAGTPGGYALGAATATVEVGGEEVPAGTATVVITVPVTILADGRTTVPLLPGGAVVTSAHEDGQPIELVATADGLAWVGDEAGRFDLSVSYRTTVRADARGRSVAIALPRAPSTELTASIAGTSLVAAVVPAIESSVAEDSDWTYVEATLPVTAGAVLSWQAAAEGARFTVSRASYRGELDGDAVVFRADFGVELEGGEMVLVPLLPGDVALTGLVVDGAEAPIAVVDGRFAAALRGRGRHLVQASFETRVDESDGLPSITMAVPQVPVSRFELALPGDKEVHVEPPAAVRRTAARDGTLAVFHAALTESLSVRWTEAAPEPVDPAEVETRANASLHHVAHVEEGVLHLLAIAVYEVTRGQLTGVELAVPAGVQVNSVEAEGAEVSDWRMTGDRDPVLSVFLDRPVAGELTLQVGYEQATASPGGASEPFTLPLLSARGVHRQRGMIALLAARELTLEPREEERLTRVGENQLPANVRDRIEMTVAHTFRYLDAAPRLVVATAARAREPGRFDARVDTLVSLGDVTTRAAVGVDVHVKSGSLTTVELTLPAGVHLLDLSAPSLREHRVRDEGGRQHVTVELTQEMEGEFRIEATYERIAEDRDRDLEVPLLHVEGAEVEQGRIAVEALAAVQVDPATTERLSPIELAELPQALLVRTSNPILLAYKYAHAAPPPELGLRVTRHLEIETQEATIDRASYRTLYTADGFAVTTATFTVRNQRKQFLRIALPAGSEVWSARVNGEPESPALAADSDEDAPAVLLNIIHSTDGFPVELVYATRVAPLGLFGRIDGELPQPDLVVTRSSWEVFLPPVADYAEPRGEMRLVTGGERVSMPPDGAEAAARSGLRIAVPAEGVRFVFDQLYAGQGDGAAGFSIPYTSGLGRVIAMLLSVLGTIALWLGLLGLLFARFRSLFVEERVVDDPLATYRLAGVELLRTVQVSRRSLLALSGMAAAGTLLLALALGWLATSPTVPIVLSSLFATASAGLVLRQRIPRWRDALRRRAEPPPSPPSRAGDPDASR
jgi:hypothetical protein